MSGMIFNIIKKEGCEYEEFFKMIRLFGITDKFEFFQIADPVYYFNEDIEKHILEHGIQSLMNFTICMEDITSPSMHIDNVESVIIKFVQSLAPAKKLVVVDPYFYEKSNKHETHKMFSRLITPLANDLEEISIITQTGNGPMKQRMHSEIMSLPKPIIVRDFQSKSFHDRFWINPLHGKGIVIGTSLNGIGNKIALVDKISDYDVAEILSLIKEEGINL